MESSCLFAKGEDNISLCSCYWFVFQSPNAKAVEVTLI